MSKKQTKKLMTPEIFHQAVIGSFVKLNPRYMMKNPVMFVVEVGCFITLLLSFLPGLFGDIATSNLRVYNIIVCVVLFVTVLFQLQISTLIALAVCLIPTTIGGLL